MSPTEIIERATEDVCTVATFEMTIPQANYDAFALLDLIEKSTGDEHANV